MKKWLIFVAGLSSLLVVCTLVVLLTSGLTKRRAEIYREAYEAGYADGKSVSDHSAYTEGFNAGRDAAFSGDYSDGYAAGYEEGRRSGYEVGQENGHTKGKKDGFLEGYEVGYGHGYYDGYDDADAGKADNPDWKEAAAEHGYIEKWW